MSGMEINSGREFDLSRDYWNDGRVRRTLHEYGRQEFPFYEKAFEALEISREDVVLDIGAGMGDDSLYIAEKYAPKIIYPLEPPPDDPGMVGTKFEKLERRIAEMPSDRIIFLPASHIDEDYMSNAPEPPPGTTYVKPIYRPAESIPLRAGSVTRPMMVHSAPEFDDFRLALAQVSGLMSEGAQGLMILNGPDDKNRFKEFLESVGEYVGRSTPPMVSAGLLYNRGADVLQEFFDYVEVFAYRDEMVITPGDRLECYLDSFNTYNQRFGPRMPGSEWHTWLEAVRINVREKIADEMAVNNGEFIDTIDTAYIKFGRPKKG